MDFSVVPGRSINSQPQHYYDFSLAPRDKAFWGFSEDPCQPETDNGMFAEVPVATYYLSGYHLLLNKLSLRTGGRNGGGKGIYRASMPQKFPRLFKGEIRPFSIDGVSHQLFLKSLKLVPQEMGFISCVAHPKLFTDESERNLTFLLEHLTHFQKMQ